MRRGGAAGVQPRAAQRAAAGAVDVPALRHALRPGAGAVGEAAGDDPVGRARGLCGE